MRPDPRQCSVRGDGLFQAISRKPQKFEVEFVDEIGERRRRRRPTPRTLPPVRSIPTHQMI